MMRVGFRVDAGPIIGTGHWMRCLALAQALREQGADVLFVSRNPPAGLVASLATFGIALDRLPPASSPAVTGAGAPPHAAWLGADPIDDARTTAAFIEGRFVQADWLIVDHYAIDARWHRAVRGASRRLMAIDDLADRALAVDLVLDQGYRHDGRDYQSRLLQPASMLPGVGHALLRDDFAPLREAALGRRAKHTPVERVLISFGGVDAANHAEAALHALSATPCPPIEVDLVIGAAALHGDALEQHVRESPHRVSIVRAAQDMAQRMALADVAFGACGFTSWERCCLGLPTIAVAAADNQKSAAAALSRTGAALVASPDTEIVAAFTEHWRRLRDDPELRWRISQSAADACDGRGARRVVEAMTRLQSEHVIDV